LSPAIIYGTAWKEDRTRLLVELALAEGFRAIDTANQRKHYCEAAVGEAIAACGLPRGELFLQTKFTYRRGQDHRLPYDPSAPLHEQVRQSMESSLQHLQTEYVDSYLLHGPASGETWTADDGEVWAAMRVQQAAGKARSLGVSNVTVEHLRKMPGVPAFVQNRCLARFGWDREVRDFCREHEIVYQGFWLLTGNAEVRSSAAVAEAARKTGATVEQTLFAMVRELGVLPLTGTSSARHMREDLASLTLRLN
jgi:diketogulonate reductase-like aldo/keto reductase